MAKRKITSARMRRMLSEHGRNLANHRWIKDPVMRLAARYGKRARLQARSRGKVVGTIKGVGFDERSLRRFFRALKKAEA